MVTKTVDSKGRITLGEQFANQQVLVERIDDTELRIVLAKTIPAREAWLYDNPIAKAAVGAGLKAAAAHEFAQSPDLKADERPIRRRRKGGK